MSQIRSPSIRGFSHLLLTATVPLRAEEYRYAGTIVRVIDGDSLIIDVPHLARRLSGRRAYPAVCGANVTRDKSLSLRHNRLEE